MKIPLAILSSSGCLRLHLSDEMLLKIHGDVMRGSTLLWNPFNYQTLSKKKLISSKDMSTFLWAPMKISSKCDFDIDFSNIF